MWAGEDLNLRRQTPADLQSAAISTRPPTQNNLARPAVDGATFEARIKGGRRPEHRDRRYSGLSCVSDLAPFLLVLAQSFQLPPAHGTGKSIIPEKTNNVNTIDDDVNNNTHYCPL